MKMKPTGVLCRNCWHTGKKCVCDEVADMAKKAATTDEEKAIVMKLAEAYEMWLKLPDRNANEAADFVAGIHRCQDVIRGRVAKRADPDFWV